MCVERNIISEHLGLYIRDFKAPFVEYKIYAVVIQSRCKLFQVLRLSNV